MPLWGGAPVGHRCVRADGLCPNPRSRSCLDKAGDREPAGLRHSGRQGRGWPGAPAQPAFSNIPGRDRRRAGRSSCRLRASCGTICSRTAGRPGLSGQAPPQGGAGSRAGIPHRRDGTDGSLSLAEITLHTGRTHQIRVQFASRKHPLYGDGKYGSRFKGDIALQSAGLQFVHPETGKPMAFSLPLPAAAPWKEFLE